MKSSPRVNFTGLDGCRSFKLTQRYEKIGASMITNSGVTIAGSSREMPYREYLGPDELFRKEIQARALLFVRGPEQHREDEENEDRRDAFPVRRSQRLVAAASAYRRRHLRRDPVTYIGQPLAENEVDDQTKNHADAGCTEAPVPTLRRIETIVDQKTFETVALCQVAANERRQHRADIYAHVKDREAAVAAWIVFAVEASDHGADVWFEQTGANRR